jgi:hypothetical protein
MDYPRHAHGDLGTLQRDVLSARVSSRGTHLAATHHMFNSDIRIVCTDLYDTPTISAVSLIILRRSACTSSQIRSTFLGVILVEGLPDHSSSSRDVLLRAHPCAAICWRATELVLELFDTPTYFCVLLLPVAPYTVIQC